MKIYFKSKDGIIGEDFSFIKYGTKNFQLIQEGNGPKKINYNDLTNEEELDLLVLNETSDCLIVKFIDFQKYLYEQKKAKKNQEKKQKAAMQKLKEIKFHINIAENDMNIKIDHAKEFLEDKCKVKLILELRGREIGMKDLAKEVWNKILSKFEGYQFSDQKDTNNSMFIFVTK